ncbi:MAG TPA: hypothetical protein VEI97_00635 [bacterium]|nr:hypothetical protein [bacterium]
MAIDRIGTQFTSQVSGRLQELRAGPPPTVSAPQPEAGDAARFGAGSTPLATHLRGIQALGRGLQEGISLVQTADASLARVSDHLGELRTAAVQAADPATDDSVRVGLQARVDQLSSDVDQAFAATSFNGKPVFGSTRQVQAGDDGGIPLEFPALSMRVLSDGPIEVANLQAAQYSLPKVDQAIERIAGLRGDLGGLQVQLGRSAAELASAAQNVVAAASPDGSGNLVEAITALKLQEVQFKVALKAAAAQLQTSDAVLELLK